jgi:protein TonB
MSQACLHNENIGEMTRLPAGEKGFALALIVSAALHTVLLTTLLSFASGFVQGDAHPLRESFFMAFLVSGNHAAVGDTLVLPGRKHLTASRAAPAAALPPEVPAHVAPAKKEGIELLADRTGTSSAAPPREGPAHVAPAEIRPSAERPGTKDDAGTLTAPASPTSPALVTGGGGLSGSSGAGGAASRRGGGDFSVGAGSGGTGAGTTAARREGAEVAPQGWSGVWPPKDADAVPRYGENARPAYPQLARLRGYQGVVVLLVEVLADGRVGQVRIKRSVGHDILDRAALEAVRSWRFEPGRREGRAVTMSVEVPVRYVLNGN